MPPREETQFWNRAWASRLAEQEERRLADVGGPPSQAVHSFYEGLDYESQGLYDKAIERYTTALTLHPQYREAREHLEKASEAAARQCVFMFSALLVVSPILFAGRQSCPYRHLTR